MPAPTQIQIYNNLKTALLSAGYTAKSYDSNGNLITDTTNLPLELDKLINTLSIGINITWDSWQASQTVAGIDTITSAPISGILP